MGKKNEGRLRRRRGPLFPGKLYSTWGLEILPRRAVPVYSGISSGFDLFIDCDLPNRDMQRTARSLHAFFSHCYVFPLTTSFQARSAAARFCKCASSTLYSVCILAIFRWVIVASYPRRRALRAIFLASPSL